MNSLVNPKKILTDELEGKLVFVMCLQLSLLDY